MDEETRRAIGALLDQIARLRGNVRALEALNGLLLTTMMSPASHLPEQLIGALMAGADPGLEGQGFREGLDRAVRLLEAHRAQTGEQP